MRCEPAFSPRLDGYLPSDPGVEPWLGVSADFDGDGRLDVALSGGSTEIGVLLGNGDGTLEDGVAYPTGASVVTGTTDPVAAFLLAHDVNGDGKLDLLAAHKVTHELAVLFGDGSGAFAPGTTCLLGGQPQGLAAGDFDGDGVADIAASFVGRGVHGIKVLRGDGSCESLGESAEEAHARPLGAGDWNGDGTADLVVAGGELQVLLSDGAGGFVAGERYENSGSPRAVTVVDLNGDAALDVVLTNVCSPWNSSSLSVRLGLGDGTFAVETNYEPAPCGAPVFVSDVNGDGALDLVPRVGRTLFGAGDGTFGPPVESAQSLGGMLVGVADFDGDALADAVAADRLGVVVRKGNGDGTFGIVPRYATGPRPAALALADLDGDGNLDIVTANGTPDEPDSGSISVLAGAGDGAFAERVDHPSSRVPSFMAVASLDGDGLPDLVLLYADARAFGVLLQTGGGGFAPPLEFPLPVYGRALALGDLNGDAVLDAVVAGTQGEALAVWLGAGDGTFSETVAVEVGDVAFDVALLDANGDDRLDLVTSHGAAAVVRLAFGRGDGTFEPARDFAVSTPENLAVGDLDRDGRPELAACSVQASTILRGSAGAGFDGGTSYEPSGRYPVMTDLDGDGHQDVLLGSPGLTVYRGAGDGRLDCYQTYSIGSSMERFAVGDLDRDGRTDVVALFGSELNLLLNGPP